MSRSDLHIHTYMSDGIYSPLKIVEDSINKQLETISITDHDVVDAISDCLEISNGRINIINGIEIGAYDCRRGIDVDMLGYCIDLKAPELKGLLSHLFEERIQRFNMVIKQLWAKGVKIDRQQLFDSAKGNYIGTSHLIKVLKETNYVEYAKDESEIAPLFFLKKYTCIDDIHTSITPKAAVKTIIKSGGIAVLAHTFRTFKDFSESEIEKAVIEYKSYGMLGIEVFHPRHNEKQIRFLHDLSKKHGLMTTAGSDYHGYHAGEIGQFSTDEEIDQDLYNRLNLDSAVNSLTGYLKIRKPLEAG